jgi:hypothetical protein
MVKNVDFRFLGGREEPPRARSDLGTASRCSIPVTWQIAGILDTHTGAQKKISALPQFVW